MADPSFASPKSEFQLGEDDLQLTDHERELASKILRPETFLSIAEGDRLVGYLAERLAMSGLSIPVTQIQGFSFSTPKLIDVIVFMTPVSHTNWNTVTTGAGLVFGARMESSGAQNDSITFNVALTPGTWEVALLYEKDPDNGIISIRIDGTEVGTIDGYAAGQATNQINFVSNVKVADAQQVELSLVMAIKNASSSNFFGRIQHIQLRKTA